MTRRVDDGRVPPHDLDSEGALIGAILIDGKYLDDVAAMVTPEQFYSERHRRVFEAITTLRTANEPVDLVTVGGWLKQRDALEMVGGLPYLIQLQDSAPVLHAKNVKAYGTAIRNTWRLRTLIRHCQSFAAQAYYDVGDVDAFIDDAERSLHEVSQSGKRDTTTESVPAIMRRMFKQLRDNEGMGRTGGIGTGFAAYDEITGGLFPGELTIVAARPGMGKTALVAQMATWIALQGMGALMFSLEMPREQITMRIACADARVNSWNVRNNKLMPADWQRLTATAGRMAQCPHFWVDDASGIPLAQIRSTARQKQSELDRQGKKLGIVAVDYLQLAKGERDRREEVIAEISRGLKGLAKELGCPVVALSQLNRGVESRPDKRPLLSDLRESGSIEQDADVVTMIYRDGYYNAETEEPNVTELIVQKQRSGPTGTVKVYFEGEYTRFEDVKTDGVRLPDDADERFG